MKRILKLTVIVAGVAAAAVPAWAQSPSVAYSFGPAGAGATGSDVQAPPSRAPGADALRWLGGLGAVQTEPKPAPIAATDRAAVSHRN
jgi:hypothetical protein